MRETIGKLSARRTVDINESNKGDPRKDIHHPGRCGVVGDHTGSGNHRGSPEFSERRISQCRPTGVRSHDR